MKEDKKLKIVKEKSKNNGKYFWSIVAANGETLAHSELYESKQGRDRTVDILIEYGFEIEDQDEE